MQVPIEVRVAIDELRHRYALHCALKQLDELLDLFADDAIFDESRLGIPVARGRAELGTMYAVGFKGYAAVHHITNGLINEFCATHAKGTCHVHAVVRVEATGSLWLVDAYYYDHYVKIDDRWRFQSRVVIPLIEQPPDEAPSA